MKADGSELRRLTDDPGHDFGAQWSPDGTGIAFVSDRDGDREIYVMNAADSSVQTRLTNSPGSDEAPRWSADGARITFVTDRDGGTHQYSMNADGTGQVRVEAVP
ncbi:MAG: TolB family protein [Acidimicrobiales bacterium]